MEYLAWFAERTVANVKKVTQQNSSPRPPGRLVVCPTPIGNLDDITIRALRELGAADVVACEDTRRTGKLLKHHGLSAKLVSYHEHNERQRAGELVKRLLDGEVVVLVSDAGMPLVSDPGFALVQGAIAADLPIEVLPGASAVTAALAASGAPSATWSFVGFLPRQAAATKKLVGEADRTLVAFESPNRLAKSLTAIAEVDPQLEVAVVRELSKLHEEVLRGTAAELAKEIGGRERVRGEVTLVIEAGKSGEQMSAPSEALATIDELVEAGVKPRRAVALAATFQAKSGKRPGIKVNQLYEQWSKGRKQRGRSND